MRQLRNNWELAQASNASALQGQKKHRRSYSMRPEAGAAAAGSLTPLPHAKDEPLPWEEASDAPRQRDASTVPSALPSPPPPPPQQSGGGTNAAPVLRIPRRIKLIKRGTATATATGGGGASGGIEESASPSDAWWGGASCWVVVKSAQVQRLKPLYPP